MQNTLIEIVIRTTYEKTCSLLEYVKSNATASNFVEPCGELLSFMTSSIVACGPETSMFCPGTITLEKESSIEELVEQLTTKNGRIGQTNKNVLTLGYRLNAYPGPPEFICKYPNSMVSHVNSPLFKELHGLIGSALFYYLLRHLSLFVSKGSCFMQVTGHHINDVCLKPTLQSQPGGESFYFYYLKMFVTVFSLFSPPSQKSPLSSISPPPLIRKKFIKPPSLLSPPPH